MAGGSQVFVFPILMISFDFCHFVNVLSSLSENFITVIIDTGISFTCLVSTNDVDVNCLVNFSYVAPVTSRANPSAPLTGIFPTKPIPLVQYSALQQATSN